MRDFYVSLARIMIPHEEFKRWAVPAGAAGEEMERAAGSEPSVLRFLLRSGEDGETEAARIEAIRSYMYDALEEVLEKLNRGLMLIEHTAGLRTRYGILAALDLEAYTMSEGETSPIRPSQKIDMREAERLSRLRANSVLEFPAVAAFYRDKKCRIVHALASADLEEVYSFDVGGEHIRGLFVPERPAWEVTEDMHPRSGIAFAVAAGEEEMAAAKLHWERIKKGLTEDEADMHPARYVLTEFVNVYDEGLLLAPVHRILSDAEPDALFDLMRKKVKCTLSGNIITVGGRDAAASIRAADACIAEFLKKNGGAVRYAEKYSAEDGETVVRMPAVEGEDVFSCLKDGKCLDAHSFVLKGCYRYEGREISYD